MRHSKAVAAPPRGRSVSRSRRARFLAIAIGLAVGIQVPLVSALGQLTGHAGLVAAGAAALTISFILGVAGPRSVWGEPGPFRLYGVLWPFFFWFTVALLFLFVLPLALGLEQVSSMAHRTALGVGLAVAAAGAAGAFWKRPRVLAHDVPIEGLPEAFDGFRVAQISDLHCGPFADGARVAAWVQSVNELRPDLIAVTGDLIASGSRFVPVVAAALSRLRAPHGVFASMGNHDYFTEDGEALVAALERAGLTVLRNRGVDVRRGGAVLHVAGVDDTWTRRHDLTRALAGRPAGAPALLLAHDPALFPEIAARGVELTLSGHTHGGQVAIPYLSRRLNLARVMTRFTNGFYRSGDAALYVNRGLGTTGPPIRIGVRPEITVLTLRCATRTASSRSRDEGASPSVVAHGPSPATAATSPSRAPEGEAAMAPAAALTAAD